MRALCILLLTLGFFVPARAAEAVSGRVIKVLPLLLDQQGRAALSPSLFDRDAYQAKLRQHASLVSAIRYDVLWSAKNARHTPITLRVELRGVGAANLPRLKILETAVTPGRFSHWTELTLGGGAFKQFTAVTAWRATLWDGDHLLGEEKSFLW